MAKIDMRHPVVQLHIDLVLDFLIELLGQMPGATFEFGINIVGIDITSAEKAVDKGKGQTGSNTDSEWQCLDKKQAVIPSEVEGSRRSGMPRRRDPSTRYARSG